jgi:hypothetical protein
MTLSRNDLSEIRKRASFLKTELENSPARAHLITEELMQLFSHVKNDYRNHRIQKANLFIIKNLNQPEDATTN